MRALANIFSQGPKGGESPPQHVLPKQKKGSHTDCFSSHSIGKSKSQGKVCFRKEREEVQSYHMPRRWRIRIFVSSAGDHPIQGGRKMAQWSLKGRCLDYPRRKHEVDGIIFFSISYLSTEATYFCYCGDSFIKCSVFHTEKNCRSEGRLHML